MNFHERARHVIEQEAEAIRSIPPELIDTTLAKLAGWILRCKGKVVTTGMGKNGYIAKRVAATMASTGTPAFYIHPGEASHGDTGMVSAGDILLAMSNSGKTREVLEAVEKIKDLHGDHVRIVVFTGHPSSPLSALADLSLSYGEIIEPCPVGLTPSSSLAVMSALADALALGVMEMRGFTVEAFGKRHWSGYLGKKIAESI